MGNCLGLPADYDHGLQSFNPGSHDSCRAPSPVRRPSYGGDGDGRPDGGGDGKEKVPATGEGGGEGSGGGFAADAVEGKLKVFTLAELKSATMNFGPDTVLGEGGFGTVFKGWVEEKTYVPSRVGVGVPIAVEISRTDDPQGWLAEVRFLGNLSHPNLVKLLGYCWEDEQFLQVYEYMQNGSLENSLFGKGVEPLSWDLRLKVAIGAAQGLAFLHSLEILVVCRGFKSSNILLDADFNAKLSEFRFPKCGMTRVFDTYGQLTHEYPAAGGHLCRASDVRGFGLVLLELLTGRPALYQHPPSGCLSLTEWAELLPSVKTKLKEIIDPRLKNRIPWNAAVLVAELISRCLVGNRTKQPSMQEVLYSLEKINLIKEKPSETMTQ